MSLHWNNLRTWDGNRRLAFEEVCCQLAAQEDMAEGASFVRTGKQDAGVEGYWVLPDGREYGWQAKFFMSSPTPPQWGQIDQSVKDALEKHPDLVRLTVCLPIDLPDARVHGKKSARDKWNEHVEKWKVSVPGKLIEFEYWGDHQLALRLSKEENRGRHYYWFHEEHFSEEWFKQKAEFALAVAGPRYTPELNIKLPIAQFFDGLSLNERFISKVISAFDELLGCYRKYPEEDVSAFGGCERLLESFKPVITAMSRLVQCPVLSGALREVASYGAIIGETIEALHNALCACHRDRTEDSDVGGAAQNLRHYESQLLSFIRGLASFLALIQSEEFQAALLQAVLVVGDAGTGKTHLFCDISKQRVDNKRPAVLVFGMNFTEGVFWAQVSQQLLDCEMPRDELLGALNAAGEVKQERCLLFIDAINESLAVRLWENIPAVLGEVKRYPWLGIAFSVRSTYESLLVPAHIGPTEWLRITHDGFADAGHDVLTEFLVHYGLHSSRMPLLSPEFNNPLFLHMLCGYLQSQGITDIPSGLPGIRKIFLHFLDQVHARLWKKLDYSQENNVVRKGAMALIRFLVDDQTSFVPLQRAEEILNELLPRIEYSKSLLNAMLSEGVLISVPSWHEEGGCGRSICFAYERFSDHLRAEFLLEHIDENSLAQSFREGGALDFLTSSTFSINQGLIEALSIQIPENYGIELPYLLPEKAREEKPVLDAFLASLVWRERSFTDETYQFIRDHCVTTWNGLREFLRVLLLVAAKPEHPFNANYLHSTLVECGMAERDADWSIRVHELYNEGTASRPINWVLSSPRLNELARESAELLAVLLSWFFTSSNRELRDRSTKALVRLLSSDLDLVCPLLERFHKVNDLYVLERVLAASYGAVLRNRRKEKATCLREIALAVEERFFRLDSPPLHLLTRDYARGIVEAVASVTGEDGYNLEAVRPPYSSTFPDELPGFDEVKNAASEQGKDFHQTGLGSIAYSLGHGDFLCYVLDSRCHYWVQYKLSEPNMADPNTVIEQFVADLSSDAKTAWQEYRDLRARMEDKERVQWQAARESLQAREPEHSGPEEKGKDLREPSEELAQQADAVGPTIEDIMSFVPGKESSEVELLRQELDEAESKLQRYLTPKQRAFFSDAVAKVLENPWGFYHEHNWTGNDFSGYALRRILDLGYDVSLHSEFDRSIPHKGRMSHGIERIGKKYQWIAYQEVLALLADNYHWAKETCDGDNSYEGSWQLAIRDIDPSSLLVGNEPPANRDPTRVWWEPPTYENWPYGDDETVTKWIQDMSDLPEWESLIDQVYPEDCSQWLLLDGHFDFHSPKPPGADLMGTERAKVWYWFRSYLVHCEHTNEVFRWLRTQHFIGRWMPEPYKQSGIFLGEWYWSPADNYHRRPYFGYMGWTQGDQHGAKPMPKPVHTTAEDFLHERGYDCAIESGVYLTLPARPIEQGMDLSWCGDGQYAGKSGEIWAQDPSADGYGRNCLLLRKQPFLEFLERDGLDIVWTILGEKQYTCGYRDKSLGRMEFSGCLRLSEPGMELCFTPHFIEPDR